MKAKVYIAFITAVVALSVTAVCFYVQYNNEVNKNADLTLLLNRSYEKEKKSVIMRSVSTQMEEIAYQQKSISDKQRSQAWQQTVIANKMRLVSEMERRKALVAEQRAMESQQKAVTASHNAESQRKLADERRLQAEYAKRTADTLNANTLVRSLGSQAVQRCQAKNEILGSLLAYAAYYISVMYQSKSLSPDVYLALSMASNGNTQWNGHQGAVMAIAVDPNNTNRFVTVDNYGGMVLHRRTGTKVGSETLVNSKAYDFRDVYIDSGGNIYALSRKGQLYVKPLSAPPSQLIVSPSSGLMRVLPFTGHNLLLVADKALYVYDTSRNKITDTRALTFSVTAVGRRNAEVLLFDNGGNVYAVHTLDNLTSSKLPFSGRVTSFAYSPRLRTAAYGTVDGTVYIQRDAGQVQKLETHRSRVSQLCFTVSRLYSSSFDGSVKYCDLAQSPLEFSSAFSCSYWIHCMASNISADEIWTGNQHGTVTRTLVSTDAMAKKIRDGLTREFTHEEWDKYIGSFLPYTTFK